MKILIISPGKKHDEWIKEGILLFEERIALEYPIEWNIFPSSSPEEEGKKIVSLIKDGDAVIVLDEKGKEYDTKSFSGEIQKYLNAGIKRLVCVIGGSYGVTSFVLSQARVVWSLSRLTFPHQLVRLILVEQIYRALSILKGSKYHHE